MCAGPKLVPTAWLWASRHSCLEGGLKVASCWSCGRPRCAAHKGLFWHGVQATKELGMMMERQKFTKVAWEHLTAAANLVMFDPELSKQRTPVVGLQVERLPE